VGPTDLILVGTSCASRSLQTSSCWNEDDFSVEIRKVQCLSALLEVEDDIVVKLLATRITTETKLWQDNNPSIMVGRTRMGSGQMCIIIRYI
jgi:hypothetical protein